MGYPQPHRASVIVLAWNGQRWLDRCLRSLQETKNRTQFRTIVIDNASTDGSAELIRRRFPDVHLIRNTVNMGFAGGNNVGIRHALSTGAEFVVLLNQDTQVSDGWLDGLIQVAADDPTVGVLSPLQFTYDGEHLDPVFEQIVGQTTTLPADVRSGQTAVSYDVPSVMGAAMMIRGRVARMVGTFDPIYFAYYEERDLCRRVRSSGSRVVVVSSSRICHWDAKEQAGDRDPRITWLFQRNRQIFLLKDPTKPLWRNFYIYIRYSFLKAILGKDDPPAGYPGLLAALRAQVDVSMCLPRILAQRWKDAAAIRRCHARRS